MPPGPMLLLRLFLTLELGSKLVKPAESTVRFSLSLTAFAEGVCAMDLRERGRAVFLLGLSEASIVIAVGLCDSLRFVYRIRVRESVVDALARYSQHGPT